jgi:hypothetical protein
MSTKIEKLDTQNILEIKKIELILQEHPDLLSMFKLLCIISNKRLNDERFDNVIQGIIVESDSESDSGCPPLSDHSSDSND